MRSSFAVRDISGAFALGSASAEVGAPRGRPRAVVGILVTPVRRPGPLVVALVALVASAMPAAATAAPLEMPGLVTTLPATITASPDIELQIQPPVDTDDTIRVSNDGSSWVVLPWAPRVEWSLTDPVGGGTSNDGSRHIVVQIGDGTDWHGEGSADIVLDREIPVVAGLTVDQPDPTRWDVSVTVDWPRSAEGSSRISLDEVNWSAWTPGGAHSVDVRDGRIGGDWSITGRHVRAQVRGPSGLISDVVRTAFDLAGTPGWQGDAGTVRVLMEVPKGRSIGSPDTLRPVYPPGYVLPADAWCEWQLHWGDDESLSGKPNASWGEIIFERPKSSGACTEWTFTLPDNGPDQFHWRFQVYRKDASQPWGTFKERLYSSPTGPSQIFRAPHEDLEPRILTSNLPIAYILPETTRPPSQPSLTLPQPKSTTTRGGSSVTYRLRVAGATTVPQSGNFRAYPVACSTNEQWSQQGGTTFTYRPTCNGTWVTRWIGTYKGAYMRTAFRPYVDARAPAVRPPIVGTRQTVYTTSVPATVSWSAADSGSGVYAYELQLSRNGGSWTPLTLRSRLQTSFATALSTTAAYRFRVRARDVLGNWSSWAYGAGVRASMLQEGTSNATWSSGWTRVADAALSGGAGKTTDVAGASVRLSVTARSIAIVGRSGPGRGLAGVFVDGAYAATVDFTAPELRRSRAVFLTSWSKSGPHTVELRNLGTLSRPLIELDSFLIVR